jgi:NAD-dependent deacetylase
MNCLVRCGCVQRSSRSASPTNSGVAVTDSERREWHADRAVRRLSWKSRLDHPAWSAQPNAAHRALVALERNGSLHALITHRRSTASISRAGTSTEKVIEVHGTMRDVMWMTCDWHGPMEPVLDRVRDGDEDPPCERCGGILSATISFGQAIVPHFIGRALRSAAEANLLLAVGTSLQVCPLAGAIPSAKASGAPIVIVNAEPTPFDDLADVVIREPIGDVLPALCGEPEAGAGAIRSARSLHDAGGARQRGGRRSARWLWSVSERAV